MISKWLNLSATIKIVWTQIWNREIILMNVSHIFYILSMLVITSSKGKPTMSVYFGTEYKLLTFEIMSSVAFLVTPLMSFSNEKNSVKFSNYAILLIYSNELYRSLALILKASKLKNSIFCHRSCSTIGNEVKIRRILILPISFAFANLNWKIFYGSPIINSIEKTFRWWI